MLASSVFQNFFLGPLRAAEGPSGKGRFFPGPFRVRGRSQNRSTAYLRGGRALWALPLVNMQLIWPAHGALYICSESGWRPSAGHPRATPKLENSFSKKLLNLKPFFEFLAFIDGATAPCKNGENRAGEPLRSTLCFSDFWQKWAQILFCTFRRGHGTP